MNIDLLVARLESSIASEQRYAREVSDHMHKVSDERDTLRAEVAALNEKLPCGHRKVDMDDSYKGCVLCQFKDGYHEYEAENEALRKALESSPCPRPVDDDYSVEDCIKNGHCGCDNNATLAQLAPSGEVQP